MAGAALSDIYILFAWQAWHLWHWAGSGGPLGRPWSPALCVAGVALLALGWVWWRAWWPLVARDALCVAVAVAGMALGDIHLRFIHVASVALGDIHVSLRRDRLSPGDRLSPRWPCGLARVQSNVQCAQAASSGRLVVTKLHARLWARRL